MVLVANQSPTAASMAASSSAEAEPTSKVDQSRCVRTGSPICALSVSRLGMRALPPRRPKLTKPSAHGQISRVRPTLAPRRRPRSPSRAKRPALPIEATMTASWIDTSICCGRPVASPVRAAKAASGPTCANATGSAQRTGGRSGSPVAKRLPVEARIPRSPARHPARGPVRPKGERWTHTAPGARSASTPWPVVASTTSASARSSSRSGSSTGIGSIVERAVHTAWRCSCWRNQPPSGGSGRVTVAPRSARIRAASAPDSPVRSTTRIPPSTASSWHVGKR